MTNAIWTFFQLVVLVGIISVCAVVLVDLYWSKKK